VDAVPAQMRRWVRARRRRQRRGQVHKLPLKQPRVTASNLLVEVVGTSNPTARTQRRRRICEAKANQQMQESCPLLTIPATVSPRYFTNITRVSPRYYPDIDECVCEGTPLTVALGVVEDVGVDAVRVGVEDQGGRVLGAQGDDLLVELLVVGVGDLVDVAQAAEFVVFRLGAAVEGENGGDASQRRQVHYQDRLGDGHDHGGSGGRGVEHGRQYFLRGCQVFISSLEYWVMQSTLRGSERRRAAYLNERFDGGHDVGHDLLGLLDRELLVVQAEEVVLVARPHREQRLVPSGQQRQALHQPWNNNQSTEDSGSLTRLMID
jgi:hypothetical protein